MLDKVSLSREYIGACLIILCIVLGVTGWFSYDTYQFQQKDRFYQYADESNKLAEGLSKDFDYVANLSEFIGRIIAQHDDPNDLNFIADIFRTKFATKNDPDAENGFFLWSVFTWADADGRVLVSNLEGVLKVPNVVPRSRYYLRMSPIAPWKLHIDKPDMGTTSKRYVIPTGMGITDKNNKLMGIITTGIDIHQLKKRLDNTVDLRKGFHFILLTDEYEVITSSSEAVLKEKDYVREKFRRMQLRAEDAADAGFIKEPFTFNDVTYRFYRNNYGYPFIVIVGEHSHMVQKEFRDAVYETLSNNTLLGCFFIILLYFFYRYIVRPMKQLAQAAHLIAKGHIDTPIPQVNSLETQQMADALHKIKKLMLHEKHLNDHIKELNNSLERRVTERTLALEKVLESKKEFIRNMSHELQITVSGICDSADLFLMRADTLDEHEKADMVQQILKSGKRLRSLVLNLLALNKIEAKKAVFTMQPHNLAESIETIVGGCQATAAKKQLTLRFEKNSALQTTISFDKIPIEQVIENLLTNAMKFTSSGGTISASLSAQDIIYPDGTETPGIAFHLKDEGVGVPENETEAIFHAFFQSTRTKTGAGGTGLGLSICYEIIKAHKGKIWCENNKNGKGCTFSFVLPITQDVVTKEYDLA